MRKTDIRRGGFSGLWSVDHIVPAKDCVIFQGKDRYKGSLLRLVNYKEDVKAKIGHRYLLANEEYAVKFRHGHTYFFAKNSTETIDVTFNGYLYPTRSLINPVEVDDQVTNFLAGTINDYLSQARESDDFRVNRPNADKLPPIKKGGKRPWARVYIHHVGQGDTIVLELPDNQLWMIDARFWRNERRDKFDEWWEERFGNRRLDRLIISHYHYDHIHSAPYIIQRYNPGEVLVNDSLRHGTASVRKLLHFSGNQLRFLKNSEAITLGKLQIHLDRTPNLHDVTKSDDPNNHGILMSLKGEKTFAFFAGDAPGNICYRYFERHQFDTNNRINHYKVSHHGSRTGYDEQYFKRLDPHESVISCGQNNRFNHPHNEVLKHLSRPTITWQMSQYWKTWELT